MSAHFTATQRTGLHPASILTLNGDNAIKGPSGYSTSCREVPSASSVNPDDIEVHPSTKSLALKLCMLVFPTLTVIN